jgi:hypothetical protein
MAFTPGMYFKLSKDNSQFFSTKISIPDCTGKIVRIKKDDKRI